VDLAVMCCTLVRRHLPFESSMKPDTSVLPHSNVFESIRTWIEAYKARCSPAELAVAQATFDMLELFRARAIEADIGLTVDENGERWVRPSKRSRHEAAVDGAIHAALVLGATIIDGPTVLRLQKEERASRPLALNRFDPVIQSFFGKSSRPARGPELRKVGDPRPQSLPTLSATRCWLT
jgi:hypothetical protein